MIDPQLLRNDFDSVVQALLRRGLKIDSQAYLDMEASRKQVQMHCEQLQAKRNALAKAIGRAKAQSESVDELMATSQSLALETKNAEAQLKTVQASIVELLATWPNRPDESVPEGLTEADNQVIETYGQPRTFDFDVQDHVALTHGQVDMAMGSELSGSRFALLHDEVARLHRALAQWMMDLHVFEHGYKEISVPVLVKPNALYGTGQLPKFSEDQFVTETEQQLTLIPTAEVPLTNVVAHSLLSEQQLPLRLCAHSLCFRKEAGSYGQDMHGLFRVHQFEKIELVHICEPDQSDDELTTLLGYASSVLKALELPYRVVSLCAGDLGFSARKTYDLEVWLPSQSRYREVSSCSNTGDFQARRMMARVKYASGKNQYLHTLNGSGLAVGRTLIAVLENCQQEDGSVLVPKVLQPYMRTERILSRKES